MFFSHIQTLVEFFASRISCPLTYESDTCKSRVNRQALCLGIFLIIVPTSFSFLPSLCCNSMSLTDCSALYGVNPN